VVSLLDIDTLYTTYLSQDLSQRDPTLHMWSKILPTIYTLFIAANFHMIINTFKFLSSFTCLFLQLASVAMYALVFSLAY